MLSDPCLLCGRLDCPDEKEHNEMVRLDMDTWTHEQEADDG